MDVYGVSNVSKAASALPRIRAESPRAQHWQMDPCSKRGALCSELRMENSNRD